MAELATLVDAGCVAASQADRPVHDTALLFDAMDYASSFDIPLVMRAQDARIGAGGCAHAGAVATRLGLAGVPVAAETIALARLLELVRETGGRLHVSRLSCARAVRMVAEAKAADLPVTCDVGVHHLFHTDADIDGFDARYASAVPFRGIEDRAALRAGVVDGTIDAICSDHAPLDADAGLAPFPQATPGVSVYDRFVALLLALPAVAGIPIGTAVRAVTDGPSRVLGTGTPGRGSGAGGSGRGVERRSLVQCRRELAVDRGRSRRGARAARGGAGGAGRRGGEARRIGRSAGAAFPRQAHAGRRRLPTRSRRDTRPRWRADRSEAARSPTMA